MITKFTILKTILFFGLWLTSYTSVCQQIVYEGLLDKKDNMYYLLSSKYNGDVAVKYNNGQIKQRYKVKDGVAQDTLINYFEDSKFDRSKFLDTSFCFMISGKIKQKKELITALINDTLKSRQEINNFIENEIGGIKKLEKLNERSTDGKLNKKNQLKIDSLNYINAQQTKLTKSLNELQEEEKQLQDQLKVVSSKPVYQPKLESIYQHENFIKNGFYKKYLVSGTLEKEGGFINDMKNGEWKEYDNDGSILLIDNFKLNVKNGSHKKFSGSIVIEDGVYTNGLMTGDWVYRHEAEGGFLKATGNFINGDGTDLGASGIPKNGRNGRWVFYDENENITNEGNYSNGKLDGLYKSYKKPGVLESEINFTQDLKNGICKFYYEDGKLKEEGNYINGKSEGVYKFYFNTGVLESEENYKQDKREGISKMFHANGKLKQEGVYITGKAEGLFKVFNENGILINERYLKNDLNNGICKFFHLNGKLKEEGIYVNGKVEGLYKTFNENGILIFEKNYKQGQLNGIGKSFYLNGKIQLEGNYLNGKEDGLHRLYNESGVLIAEKNYENGKEKSPLKIYNEKGEVNKSGNSVYNDISNYQDKMFKSAINELNEMKLNGRAFTQKEYDESYKCKYCLKEINGWKKGYQSNKIGYNPMTDDYLLKVLSPKGLRDMYEYCSPKCAVEDNK